MSRCYNFCAGPAALPESVLEIARNDMLEWHGKGLSLMEMSHRSPEVVGVVNHAEQTLRSLLGISEDYAVLFLQGGASTQFGSVPLNLLGDKLSADYVNTGQWSKKAIEEGRRYCEVNVVASSQDTNFSTIPPQAQWQLGNDAAYLHYTPNETIGGVEYFWTPQVEVPLVADMSSTILSRPTRVEDFGVIYAGAQKNIGPAGVTLIIIRDDLVGLNYRDMPTMLNYETHVKKDSMFNTPPVFSVFVVNETLKWLEKIGGMEKMDIINRKKAEKLYSEIESNKLFESPIRSEDQSLMNVPFIFSNRSHKDQSFLDFCSLRGLKTLKGHRSVGGFRASIYNAMEERGVDALIDAMQSYKVS